MSVHTVRCAKDHHYLTGIEPGGPVVEVEDGRPDRIVVDGDVLLVKSWIYGPRTWVTPGSRYGPYWSEAWIEADLPAENGACLTLHYPDGETTAISLGMYEPEGWSPLEEKADELIRPHRGCVGAHCVDLCCYSRLLDDDGQPAPSVAATIVTWRRIGAKPINLSKPEPLAATVYPEPPTSELDAVVRSGRTVTLEEYRRMQR